jgi:4-hydroxymandelate oxidase
MMIGSPVLEGATNLPQLEALARPHLQRVVFDYIAGGAADELSLANNRAAFDRLFLAPRVLVDVSVRDPSTTILGSRVAAPMLVAPTALHRMAHPDGELATARAARAFGTTMVLSTLSTTAVEDVAQASGGALWFQLYVYRDRAATEDLIARVEAAGAKALVVTVDAPMFGLRERDGAHPMTLPTDFHAPNLRADGGVAGSVLAETFAAMVDPALAWRDLAWLRSRTRLPVLLKGVLRADDAEAAVGEGIDGIVVSNHGGRQLDGARATIDALPAIVDACAGAAKRPVILLDSGVRRGTDILKALALGADAVLVGRPVLYGLAIAGETGVAAVLEMLRAELEVAMALCGCADVGAIGRDLVVA